MLFKQTTNKTLHVKGQKCSNGKQSKERLTLMLCKILQQMDSTRDISCLALAIDMARDLQLFCAEQGLSEALFHTDALDDALMNEWYLKQSAARQTKMIDFFKTVSK